MRRVDLHQRTHAVPGQGEEGADVLRGPRMRLEDRGLEARLVQRRRDRRARDTTADDQNPTHPGPFVPRVPGAQLCRLPTLILAVGSGRGAPDAAVTSRSRASAAPC